MTTKSITGISTITGIPTKVTLTVRQVPVERSSPAEVWYSVRRSDVDALLQNQESFGTGKQGAAEAQYAEWANELASRGTYVARFDSEAAAIDFEVSTLDAITHGMEGVPDAAFELINGSYAALSTEYWAWLIDQHMEADDE